LGAPFPEPDQLRTFLRDRIAPLLAVDRGDVQLGATDAGERTVTLRYGGACAGCPGLGTTHTRLVVPLLLDAFPGVLVVRAAIEGETVDAAACGGSKG
jgi:Fe-S cluster biogenesis protein NfuA